MTLLRKHWPLLAAYALLAALALWAVAACRAAAGGHLIYTLDDPYIHMAMAKNLARSGTWGVSPFGFTGSSSSPLWLVLLAIVYRIGGVNEVAPLVMNLIFGALLLLTGYGVLRRFTLRSITIALLLAAMVLLVPVIPMAMTGMEHLLHAMLSVAFLFLAAELIPGQTVRVRSLHGIALMSLALLLTAARYEGLFLVAAAVLLLLLRRRFALAAGLVVAAFAPVVAYGIFSLRHGWSFLPNSLLLKGNMPQLSIAGILKFLGLSCYKALALNPAILVLTLAGLIILYAVRARGGSLRSHSSTMIIMALIATLVHLQLARTGWFYRYEAYLVAMWVVAIGSAFPFIGRELAPVLGRGKLPVLLLVATILVGIAPLIGRGAMAHVETPQASRNIYEQQYQMGRFLGMYYSERGVAANDIGAIDFLADIDVLDLWGLASIEVARAKMSGTFDTQRIRELAGAHRTGIAIVYDEWFTDYGGLPPSWVKVGQWTIHDNVVAAGSTVSFYATDPFEGAYLAGSLRAFSKELPPTVTQSGPYLEKPHLATPPHP